jgi:hypothetical protein
LFGAWRFIVALAKLILRARKAEDCDSHPNFYPSCHGNELSCLVRRRTTNALGLTLSMFSMALGLADLHWILGGSCSAKAWLRWAGCEHIRRPRQARRAVATSTPLSGLMMVRVFPFLVSSGEHSGQGCIWPDYGDQSKTAEW